MRPITRPERPYTSIEILDKVEQHFLKENNPRSYSDEDRKCYYGKTGCAVDCLLISEDAEILDNAWELGIPIYKAIDYSDEEIRDIYKAYFTPEQVTMLAELQKAHDSLNVGVVNIPFKERMTNVIAKWRKELEKDADGNSSSVES